MVSAQAEQPLKFAELAHFYLLLYPANGMVYVNYLHAIAHIRFMRRNRDDSARFFSKMAVPTAQRPQWPPNTTYNRHRSSKAKVTTVALIYQGEIQNNQHKKITSQPVEGNQCDDG